MAITPNTKLNVTVISAVTIIAAIVGAAIKAQMTLTAINDTGKELSRKLESTNEKLSALDEKIQERFTKAEAVEWALRTQNLNPTLRIPDPRNPSQLLSAGGWIEGEPKRQNTRADWIHP